MFEKNLNLPLDKLRIKIIKTGLIGIILFMLSVVGAGISHYLAYTPDYISLSRLILSVSVIVFIFGVSVLIYFRKLINLYNLKNNNSQNQ